MALKLTHGRFLEKAEAAHGTKYDYSGVAWTNGTNSTTRVNITCRLHGVFQQSINNHTNNRQGCPECSGSMRLNFNSFVRRARAVHGDTYEYTNSEWVGCIPTTHSHVTIRCSTHGPFKQRVSDHINSGSGCPGCAGKARITNELFASRAAVVHGDLYDYSNVPHFDDNTNNRAKVPISCKKHGVFSQRIADHLNGGYGCPHCNSSRGEISIRNVLVERGMQFKQEHSFEDCRNPSSGALLRFDFWLPDYNTCIEFHGKQHYEPVLFGVNTRTLTPEQQTTAIHNLVLSQERDKIKEEYCKSNNIELLVIPYTAIGEVQKILASKLSLSLQLS